MRQFLLRGVMIAGFCTAAIPGLSAAGPNAGANIELHILSTTTENACTRAGTLPDCTELVNEAAAGRGNYYYVHVLVTGGNPAAGIGGLQFGIQYTGRITVYDWQLCALLEFPHPTPTWPASGGGILITWDFENNCQVTERPGMGVVANAGYFYLGASGATTMSIVPRPVDGAAKLASCGIPQEDVLGPEDLGMAAFGLGPGTG